MTVFPRSLRGLTIVFLVFFMTVTMAAGFGTFFAASSTINSLVDQRIAFESHEIAPLGRTISRQELDRRIDELTGRRDTADLGILLTDGRGHVIAGNTRFTRPIPLGFSSLSDEDSIEGLSAGRVFVRRLNGGMRLAIFAETEPIDDYRAFRKVIYVTGFGAIVLVVLTGLLLFHRLIGRRIDEMRRTAESIIEGDLAQRVPVAGDGGEFDQQAATFNRMLDRIGQLLTEIRNVSNNISHEMRTPLARLRNALASLEERADADPVRPELEMARDQADDLLAMFSAMLRIAEIESGSRRAGFEKLDLSDLLQDMVGVVRPLAEENAHPIEIVRCDRVALAGDRQLLSQLLVNLMENAVTHTPEGTVIRVSVERQGDGARLIVADNGPGIAEGQQALVMRRFGRLERSGRGHGLGLPLADAIVRLHGGTLMLEDAAPGLRIVVALPG